MNDLLKKKNDLEILLFFSQILKVAIPIFALNLEKIAYDSHQFVCFAAKVVSLCCLI